MAHLRSRTLAAPSLASSSVRGYSLASPSAGSLINRGFTLIELMVTMVIIGVATSIALPLYSGYMADSRTAVMKNNIQGVGLFETNYQLQHKTYISGTYNPSTPGGADGLKARIGWSPSTQPDTTTYVVTCEVPNANASLPQCDRSGGFTVKATDSAGATECTGFAGAACP